MNNVTSNILTIRDLADTYSNYKVYKLILNNFPLHTRKYLSRSHNKVDTILSEDQIAMENFLNNYKADLELIIQDFIPTVFNLDKAHKNFISAEVALMAAERALSKSRENFKNISYAHQNAVVDSESLTIPDIDHARKELITAEATFIAAQKELSMAKENFENTLSTHQQLENAVNEKKAVINNYTKKFSKHYILVHNSATVSSLSKKIRTGGILVCSKYDANTMSYSKHVDKIIKFKEDYSDFIPDDAQKYFTSEEDFTSAKEYVNLVIHFMFNKFDYELLYNSAGIKYILDSFM